MNHKKTPPSFYPKRICAIAVPLILSAQVQGLEFYNAGIEGSINSEISMGSSWRVEEQDNFLTQDGNYEDGNKNFAKGDAFSQIFKGSHELQMSYQNFGGVVSGRYWYDSALKDNNVRYGHAPTATIGTEGNPNDQLSVNQAGESRLDDSSFNDLSKFSGTELMDAFVYGEFSVLDMPLDVRLGRQVVSWGESTFIPGGVNNINPIDINAFTRPGSEVKEALLPVNMAYANVGLSDNVSAEAFYQLEFQQSVLPGCGTYFAPSDYVSEGCDVVTIAEEGASLQRNEDGIRKPNADGQYGLALRFVSESLADTEFGIYYMNVHSRTPVANGISSYLSEAQLNVMGQTAAGQYIAGVTQGTRAPTAEEMATAEQVAMKTGLGAKLATSSYFVSYPEDLQILGLSFSTNLGGIAWSGELSHKLDAPMQMNANELIEYTLTVGESELVEGYKLFDISQTQVTAIKFFDRALGADRITLVTEAAYTFVHNLEKSGGGFNYGRADIYTDDKDEGYVTEGSWGYRTLVEAEYPDAFAGVNLTPRAVWSHDVKGYGPETSGAFIEGQQSLDLSLHLDYLSTYKASVSYTQYMGGDYTTRSDRDFASISVGMQF
ncbi:MAG: DUF1302 domain-containing protein [Bermanella sp.]